MSKVYNQEQQEFIRTARQAYVEHVAEIDRQKEYVKETFESYFDGKFLYRNMRIFLKYSVGLF